jgi:hypothetical protein
MNVYQDFNIYLRQKKPTREGLKKCPISSYPIVFFWFLLIVKLLLPGMLSCSIPRARQAMAIFSPMITRPSLLSARDGIFYLAVLTELSDVHSSG